MNNKKKGTPAEYIVEAEQNRDATIEKLSTHGTLEQKDSNHEEIEATQTDPGPNRQPTEERIKAMVAEMRERGVKEMIIPGFGYVNNEGGK